MSESSDNIDRGVTGTIVLLLCCAAGTVSALAGDVDEFKIKRQEVFEFTKKPTIKRDGDKVTIRFASKGYCDATVAIEDSDGRIVRHLASGVLGPNAPAPLQKDSLAQVLVWDGKADHGRYIDDLAGATVRVSLGGDEVGLMHPAFVGVHTDRRLFIQDYGNARILSVKLDYHASESVPLRAAPGR